MSTIQTLKKAVAFVTGTVRRKRQIEKISTELPEDYNLHDLHRIARRLERDQFLGKWLYWSEIAGIAYHGRLIPEHKVPMIRSVLAWPFDMLPKGDCLVVGEYQIEPHEPYMSRGWYRIDRCETSPVCNIESTLHMETESSGRCA